MDRAARIAPDDKAFDALLQDLIQDGGAADIAGIVSGYLASEGQAHGVARLVAAVKAVRPDALYLCDPVIGDAGRVYVGEALAVAIRDALLPLADVATPNAFECAWLAGQADAASPDLAALAKSLAPATVPRHLRACPDARPDRQPPRHRYARPFSSSTPS